MAEGSWPITTGQSEGDALCSLCLCCRLYERGSEGCEGVRGGAMGLPALSRNL